MPAQLTIRFDSLPAAFADRPEYLWLHHRDASGWTPVAGQPVDLAARTVTGAIDGFSSYGVKLAEFVNALRLAATQLDALLNDATAETTIALLATVGGILQWLEHPAFDALAQPVLDRMQTTACNAFATAVDNARAAPVNDWGVLTSLLRPAYYWSAVAAKFGALDGCPNAALTLGELQQIKIDEFVAFYIGRLNPASFDNDFERIVAEVDFVVTLREELLALGMPDAEAVIRDAAQFPLMDALRAAAYVACREVGRHDYLGRLRLSQGYARYEDDDLLGDLQQCGTQMTWLVSSTEPPFDDGGSLGGTAPGTAVVLADAPGIAAGRITLGGTVRAFRCADGSFADDQLIVTFDGVEVARRTAASTGGSLLGAPLYLDAATILAAAGIDPEATASVPLVVARESLGCGLYVMSLDPVPLATLRLAYPAPTSEPDPEPALDVSGSWTLVVEQVCSGTIQVGQTGTALAVSGSIGGAFCPYSASGSGTGTINGSAITFGLAFGTAGGGSGSVTFEGTVAGNTMQGTYNDGSGEWSATRQ